MVDLIEAMKNRHAVRSYTERKIDDEVLDKLNSFIYECNKEGDVNIQLIVNEPRAFDGIMAHYGKFSGVKNYLAMVGKKGKETELGYYGEKIVLYAQSLGLNSCWVAMTYSKIKGAYIVNPGEKMFMVVTLGYGENQGVPHVSKSADEVSVYRYDLSDKGSCIKKTEDEVESGKSNNGKIGDYILLNKKENSENDVKKKNEFMKKNSAPEWFKRGVDAALLAPTSLNRQKFKITGSGNKVKIQGGIAYFSKIDIGIVKYHFEVGAGKENFEWV